MYYGEDGRRPLHAIREIEALQALHGHPHIVQLLDLAEAPYSMSLVLQHCITDLGTLFRHRKGVPLPLATTRSIFQQLLAAVAAVHHAGFLHRDISPGNVLFDEHGSIRLSDFGQARKNSLFVVSSPSPSPTESLRTETTTEHPPPSPLMSSVVGTRWYRAPELLFGARTYSNTIDIWSLGCLLGEALTGSPLFPGNSDIDQLCRIREALGTLTEEEWSGVKELPDWGKLIFPPQGAKPWGDVIAIVGATPGEEGGGAPLTKDHALPRALSLLSAMLRYDPDMRISAQEALQHDFFDGERASAQEVLGVLEGGVLVFQSYQ